MNLEQELQQWGGRAEGSAPTISLEEITARAAEPDGDVVLLSPLRFRRGRPRLFAVGALGAAAALALGVLVLARNRDAEAPVATEPRPATTTVPATSSTIEPRAAGFDPRWLPTELPEGWSVVGAYRSTADDGASSEVTNVWTFPDGRTAVFFEGSEGLQGLLPPGDLADVVADNDVTLLLGGWPNDRLAIVRGFPDAEGRRRMLMSDSVSEAELADLMAGTSEQTVTSTPLYTTTSATVWLRGPNDESARISVVPPGPGANAFGAILQEVALALGGEATVEATVEATFVAWAPAAVAVLAAASMRPADLAEWDALERVDPSILVPEPPTTVESPAAQIPSSGRHPIDVSFDASTGSFMLHSQVYGDTPIRGVEVWQGSGTASASDDPDPFTARTILAVMPAATVRVEGELGDGSVIGGGTGSVVAVPGTDQLVGVLDGPIGEPVRAVIGYDAAGNVTQRYGRPPFESASGG